MRTLADRRHEQERANADDRELESRSDRRRQQDARETMLKDVANRLCSLKQGALERLSLDEELLGAIATAQAIRSAPARNRQVNVVRQHLRALGPELDALVRRLEGPVSGPASDAQPAAPSRQFSPAVLSWADRLADEGDAALNELLEQRPGADRQQLRQRMRELARARSSAPAATARAAEVRLRELVLLALQD